MKINFKVNGDHLDGKFAPLAVELERDGTSVEILFTAEQTELALENDDKFRHFFLKDVLADSGITIHQTIVIENGDESEAQHNFMTEYNGILEEPYTEEISKIEIKFSNPDDPDNGNIELLSSDDSEFTIFTEGDSLTPTETAEKLRIIFNQD